MACAKRRAHLLSPDTRHYPRLRHYQHMTGAASASLDVYAGIVYSSRCRSRDKRDKHSVAGDEERLFRASEKEKQAPDLREDEKRR